LPESPFPDYRNRTVLAQALIEPRVREALADTPVALVIGPKRARKTTLVRAMGELAQDYLTTAF
jgi:predicted AAA+ superfamily ATPase